jgi:hypothetical protein
MNKKIFVWMSVFVLLSVSVLGACTYTYDNADSQDYFDVNTANDNVSVVASTELWTDWSFFTPRLNFTKNVSETFLVGASGTNNSLKWRNLQNFNATAFLYNNSVVVGIGNYSILQNGTSNQWYVYWKTNNLTGYNVTIYFLKNFTKNVDDIVTNSSGMYRDATRSSFLVENTPSDYGDYKTFRFNSADTGRYVNNTNWAVGWNYTSVDCSIGEFGCSAGASSLWSILAIVVVAGFLLWLFTIFEGSVTVGLIVLITIVALLIPYLIDILNSGC